jgi:PAS domain S-box-containing protein
MRFEDSRFWFGVLGDDLSHAVRRRTAAWLGTVARASGAVIVISGIAAVFMHSMPVWSIYGAFGAATLLALVLNAANRTREAGVVLSVGFWLSATAAVFLLGGVQSPGSFVFLPIVITAGLFWSWRAAAVLTAASLAVEIVAALLDARGMLPSPLQPPTAGALLRIFAGSLTMTAVLVGVALHSLRGALAEVRRYALRTEELLVEMPGVIAVLDRLGVVLGVSPAAEELTGYSPAELVGRHISRLDLFARDRSARADDFRAFASGPGKSREVALIAKDGERLWAEARKQSLVLFNGESLVRIVLSDTTRRRRAEEREAELSRAVDRARRLEAMGLSVGGVAHDLNNLLTVILSVGSVLETRVPEDRVSRDLLDDLKESALRAATLARQLLSSRPEQQAEPIDIHGEIRDLGSLLSRLAGSAVRIDMQVDPEPCFVRIERGKLEQIAINLVVNARDAMPNGGSLVVKTSRFKDEEDQRRWVELSIIDCGVGMDSVTKQRIFEPFYTTKGAAGTGLGMATVDGIVSRVGGRIQVDSAPGCGTRVRVILPEAFDVSSTPPAYETRPE